MKTIQILVSAFIAIIVSSSCVNAGSYLKLKYQMPITNSDVQIAMSGDYIYTTDGQRIHLQDGTIDTENPCNNSSYGIGGNKILIKNGVLFCSDPKVSTIQMYDLNSGAQKTLNAKHDNFTVDDHKIYLANMDPTINGPGSVDAYDLVTLELETTILAQYAIVYSVYAKADYLYILSGGACGGGLRIVTPNDGYLEYPKFRCPPGRAYAWENKLYVTPEYSGDKAPLFTAVISKSLTVNILDIYVERFIVGYQNYAFMISSLWVKSNLILMDMKTDQILEEVPLPLKIERLSGFDTDGKYAAVIGKEKQGSYHLFVYEVSVSGTF